jgi:hypothetical protein
MAENPNQDPESNLPDWLRALRQKQAGKNPEPTPQPDAAPESTPEEEPDWLQEIRKRHRGDTAHDEDEAERALTDTQPNQPLRLEKRRIEPQPEPESEEPASEVPDWLEMEPEPAEDELEDEAELAESEPEEPSVVPAFGAADLPADESISPGELPSWLQAIRPGGDFAEGDEDAHDAFPAAIENAGPLAGLSGVLPAEPEIARLAKAPVFSNRLDISENQYRHAAVLRDLLAAEEQPRQDHATAVARPARILNAVMAGLVLLAAAVPLFTGAQSAPRPELNAFPEGAEVFNAIDVLPADAPVLVGFDVEPALYGEMQPALAAVLGHLLQKQARLVFISTQPSGPALAERLLQEQFATTPAITSGDYINLGYLSGGMAALRSFSSAPRVAALSVLALGQNPWENAALQNIEDIGDFALVLVVTSEGEDGRAWIEQAGPSLPGGLLLVTSAQAAPVLRPYLSAEPPTARGLVAGLAGAAHYERLRASDGLGRGYWDSFSYGLGAVVLVILLGGLYGRLIQMRPETVRVKSE